MSILSTRVMGAFLAVLLVFSQLLSGCGSSGESDSGGKATGDSSASGGGKDCSNVTAEGWDLFVDPRLIVQPSKEVYPLEAGDSISFRDTSSSVAPNAQYFYQLAIITDSGAVSPNSSGGFKDVTADHAWTLNGPVAAKGVSGGPHLGIMKIETADGKDVTKLATLCVSLAKGE
jgi:hypothetical protein